jgi:hypothetical protein
MKCPKCKLENLKYVQRCDCGYNFESEKSNLSNKNSADFSIEQKELSNKIEIKNKKETKDKNSEEYDYDYQELWNPKSLLFMSIVLSAVPAIFLCGLNFGRLGRSKEKNFYIFAAFFLFCLQLLTTNKEWYYYLLMNTIIGIHINNEQKKMYQTHIVSGGKKASLILPVIIWTLFFLVYLFISLVIDDISNLHQKM